MIVIPLADVRLCTTVLATSMLTESDERYEVLAEVGHGEMGTVFKVRDRELDEVVAIKALNSNLAIDPAAVAEFKRELKLTRRINHPNVARLYHLFRWRGGYAIEQALVPGRSLDKLIPSTGCDLEWTERVMRYVCSGVDAAHRVGVLHRDLKPSNIMVDDDGAATIVDFGVGMLAGLARRGGRFGVGTPGYMSPEQVLEPTKVELRSDIYSLGVVLYEMVTGRMPFIGDRPHEVLAAQLSGRVAPASQVRAGIPYTIDSILARCLAREPSTRYGSALAIYSDLSHAIDAPPPRPSNSMLSRGRVLVVDDDADTRILVEAVLARLGVEVLHAEDGAVCLDLAAKELPDLILLDVEMPRVDGRDALRALKANAATRTIPVVMLTGLIDPEEALLSKGAGASLFLNKPVQTDVLELVVAKFLRP